MSFRLAWAIQQDLALKTKQHALFHKSSLTLIQNIVLRGVTLAFPGDLIKRLFTPYKQETEETVVPQAPGLTCLLTGAWMKDYPQQFLPWASARPRK